MGARFPSMGPWGNCRESTIAWDSRSKMGKCSVVSIMPPGRSQWVSRRPFCAVASVVMVAVSPGTTVVGDMESTTLTVGGVPSASGGGVAFQDVLSQLDRFQPIDFSATCRLTHPLGLGMFGGVETSDPRLGPRCPLVGVRGPFCGCLTTAREARGPDRQAF